MGEDNNDFPHLPDDEAVKNLKGKIDEIGKPSVFIGSVSESIWISELAQSYFDKEVFEVDAWHQGIFQLTKTSGGSANNAEQLKNFTDIYDFAIFIFSPDDKIVSQYRKDKSGKYKKALATRHNVVFEFGLFLGRIGAKRSFILFDDNSKDFIEDFFTDLKENINDTEEITDDDVDNSNKFRLELYQYKGTDREIESEEQRKKEFDYNDFKLQVEKIQKRIVKTFKGYDIGFLPSTSLAIGYYKNFLKIVIENIFDVVSNNISASVQEEIDKKPQIQEFVSYLTTCDDIQFKIIKPSSIQGADPDIIKAFLKKSTDRYNLPGKSRNMGMNIKKRLSAVDNKQCIIYDVPTTMSISLDAIQMLNSNKDIIELLSEKERVNFMKVLKHKLEEETNNNLRQFINKTIKFITWEEFHSETKEFDNF
ncbi:nucleotide-binding protein [Psychroserpens sp. SPM9]|uniref:nucleotide-binding protein n=1 Tax=Psychroserpens sp. SPM9 TaxID=2975598 RepID=UPI0021A48855|nr:nucleotide-binding protein [Psychroserpens sp. SPM9]MDG5490589.1 nucleotide-binding protein [Psychroserpens sp. SPM9]